MKAKFARPVPGASIFTQSLLLLSSVLLSLLTVVLGALPLRVWIKSTHRAAWLVLCASASITLYLTQGLFAGISFFTLVLLVAIYTHFEEKGWAWLAAGSVAVGASSLFAVGAAELGLRQQGQTLLTVAKQNLEQVAKQVAELQAKGVGTQFSLDTAQWLAQMPSGILLLAVVALALALTFERRVARGLRLAYVPRVVPLKHMRLPQHLVWLALAAAAGSFLRQSPSEVQMVALNVFNILLVVYFFQGLAVAQAYFDAFGFSPFWRGLSYFLFVFQLFPFISGVGFVEFWLELRAKLNKRTIETNNLKDNKGGSK